jgi:hypothetical protein
VVASRLEALDIDEPTFEPIESIERPAEAAPAGLLGRVGRVGFLAPTSPVPTVAGILVIAAGFALIAVGWAEVAGLTNVALQTPYVVSAGLTGLALVMVGVLGVHLAVRRQDEAERARQMEQLTDVMRALRDAVEERR